MNTKYDYIFAGLGASGFSLLLRLIKQTGFGDKKVLLIDVDTKDKNDRTWCFWEKENGFFEEIVSHSWSKLNFYSPRTEKTIDITPYHYKMIKGKDFYRYCWKEVKQHTNITFKQDNILYVTENKVVCESGTYLANLIFNSAIREIEPTSKDHHLLQHFKGVVIETPRASFDENKPTLMDFRVHQNNGCSFVYTMPLSPTKALVEYTIFSKKLLQIEEYDKELKQYIKEYLQLKNYKIEEEEYGVIPMTTTKINRQVSENIINLGTAGGQTKASTGYTFTNIQAKSDLIATNLKEGKTPLSGVKSTKKFDFFDAVLLNIMDEGRYPIWKAFDDMFSKLPAPMVLDFLDNKTKLPQDIKIMASVHTPTFLKSAVKKMLS